MFCHRFRARGSISIKTVNFYHHSAGTSWNTPHYGKNRAPGISVFSLYLLKCSSKPDGGKDVLDAIAQIVLSTRAIMTMATPIPIQLNIVQ